MTAPPRTFRPTTLPPAIVPPTTLPLPDLDDRAWADLIDEAREMIPGLDPAWTDHGPTDPGMVLVELLAWLTEMLFYRINRVSEASVRRFLKLISGSEPDPDTALDEATRATLLGLRQRYRAVTAADYVELATRRWPQTSGGRPLEAQGLGVRRALPVADFDLSGLPPKKAKGHLSLVVVVPRAVPPRTGSEPLDPARIRTDLEGLVKSLGSWLDPRKLAGTLLHVSAPHYVELRIAARVTVEESAITGEVERAVVAALDTYFHPLAGGARGDGWPFGRDISLTDVYRALSRQPIPGLAEVVGVTLAAPRDAGRERRAADGRVDTVELEPYELPWLTVAGAAADTAVPKNVPGLGLWLTPDSAQATAGQVTKWIDRSGSGRDATAEGSGPTLVSSDANAHTALRFESASRQRLQYDGAFLANADYTIFIVERRRSGKKENYFLGGTDWSQETNLHLGYREAGVLTHAHYRDDLNVDIPAFQPPGTFALTAFIFSRTAGRSIRRFGKQIAHDNHTTPLTSYRGSTIGFYNTAARDHSGYYDGDIAELVIYGRALLGQELEKIEHYLLRKHGLTAP